MAELPGSDQQDPQILARLNELERLEHEWSGNLGHWHWEYQTNTVTFNPLKIQALGYELNEVPDPIGFQFFTNKIHPADYQRVMDNMLAHISGTSDAYEVEYRIQAKNGTWKWFYDRGVITGRDSKGKPKGIAGIVFDVSQRKNLEEELRLRNLELATANATKDRLFSIIAHDLRGPIGSMPLLLTELEGNTFSPEEKVLALAELRASAQQTYTLLENLLSWSLLQSGSTRPVPASLNVAALIQSIIQLLHPQASHKEITLSVSAPDELQIWADEKMISTVLRNLVSNAIKFTPRQGSVTVTVVSESDQAFFCVQDTGQGMDNSRLATLFSPSQKASSPGTEGEPGTGLGLILCQEMVKQNGGELSATSGLGHGSQFRFSLPLEKNLFFY